MMKMHTGKGAVRVKKQYIWPVIAAVLVVFTICLIITVAHSGGADAGEAAAVLAAVCPG